MKADEEEKGDEQKECVEGEELVEQAAADTDNLDKADITESQAEKDKNKREKKPRKDKKKDDNDQKYKVKSGSKTMTYKVKGNASAPATQEANDSPDTNQSKQNTDGKQYEAYNQEADE